MLVFEGPFQNLKGKGVSLCQKKKKKKRGGGGVGKKKTLVGNLACCPFLGIFTCKKKCTLISEVLF